MQTAPVSKAAPLSVADIDALLDDRPDEGVFRVSRAAVREQAIFDLEMRHIFEGSWVFLGLACQIPNRHDFFTTRIGRQPVIVSRDGAGVIRCVINSCRHRGALVCHRAAGNAKRHTCQYHGWVYDSSGACVDVKDEQQGAYTDAFRKEDHGLAQVRLGDYRGFLFGSLNRRRRADRGASGRRARDARPDRGPVARRARNRARRRSLHVRGQLEAATGERHRSVSLHLDASLLHADPARARAEGGEHGTHVDLPELQPEEHFARRILLPQRARGDLGRDAVERRAADLQQAGGDYGARGAGAGEVDALHAQPQHLSQCAVRGERRAADAHLAPARRPTGPR